MLTDSPSSAGFFEEKYRRNADPWNFATSAYEQERYAATVTALAHRRYREAYEPGCSIGVFTEKLAEICDQVTACDFSQTAVQEARQRCKFKGNVALACAPLSAEMVPEDCDLLVLSEIGYYFSEHEWMNMVRELIDRLGSGATVLAVHWLGHSADHQISGDRVHQVLESVHNLRHDFSERREYFRIDRWEVR